MKQSFKITLCMALIVLVQVSTSNQLFAQPGGGGSGASTTYTYGTDISGLWQYNSSADVYYIVGIIYCQSPADNDYEQMGIYIPAAEGCVSIYDYAGRLVKQQNTVDGQVTFNVKDLPTGIYHAQCGKSMVRFVIE